MATEFLYLTNKTEKYGEPRIIHHSCNIALGVDKAECNGKSKYSGTVWGKNPSRSLKNNESLDQMGMTSAERFNIKMPPLLSFPSFKKIIDSYYSDI